MNNHSNSRKTPKRIEEEAESQLNMSSRKEYLNRVRGKIKIIDHEKGPENKK